MKLCRIDTNQSIEKSSTVALRFLSMDCLDALCSSVESSILDRDAMSSQLWEFHNFCDSKRLFVPVSKCICVQSVHVILAGTGVDI